MVSRMMLLVPLLLATAPAVAMPAPRITPGVVEGPRLAPAGVAGVSAEEVRLRCTSGAELMCVVEASWTLRGGAGGEVIATLEGSYLAVDAFQCAGGPACDRVPPEPAGAAEDGPPPSPTSTPPSAERAAAAVRLTIAAGEERILTLRGTLSPPHTWYGSFVPVLSAVRTRHPTLGGQDEARHWVVTVLPSRNRAADHHVAVSITADGVDLTAPDGRPGPGTSLTLDGDTAPLSVSLDQPAPLFVHGGPLVAFGATVDEDADTFRMRVGYEFAAPSWLLYSVVFETDCQDIFIVTPAVEAALPFVLLLPSLGLGAGAPIRIEDGDVRVGARLQVSVAFPYVSLVVPFDLYPSLRTTDPGFFEATVMAQFSL